MIKIVATRCQILRLKCTESNFGWGSAGGAYSASLDLAGLRGHTSKGRGREWEGEEGEGRGLEGEGILGEGTRPHPFTPPNP